MKDKNVYEMYHVMKAHPDELVRKYASMVEEELFTLNIELNSRDRIKLSPMWFGDVKVDSEFIYNDTIYYKQTLVTARKVCTKYISCFNCDDLVYSKQEE